MFTELWCGLTIHHRAWLTKLRDQIGNLNLLKQWPIVKPTNLVLKVCASFPKTFHPKILPIPDFFFNLIFISLNPFASCFFFLSFLKSETKKLIAWWYTMDFLWTVNCDEIKDTGLISTSPLWHCLSVLY